MRYRSTWNLSSAPFHVRLDRTKSVKHAKCKSAKQSSRTSSFFFLFCYIQFWSSFERIRLMKLHDSGVTRDSNSSIYYVRTRWGEKKKKNYRDRRRRISVPDTAIVNRSKEIGTNRTFPMIRVAIPIRMNFYAVVKKKKRFFRKRFTPTIDIHGSKSIVRTGFERWWGREKDYYI